MWIKVTGRVGTNEPQERRKKDCETGDGVCKIGPLPQLRPPLPEFHRKDIDFPSIEFQLTHIFLGVERIITQRMWRRRGSGNVEKNGTDYAYEKNGIREPAQEAG